MCAIKASSSEVVIVIIKVIVFFVAALILPFLIDFTGVLLLSRLRIVLRYNLDELVSQRLRCSAL